MNFLPGCSMKTGTKKLQLREAQVAEVDVFTRAQKSYKNKADDLDELSKKERKKSKVRYRGFAVRIHHEQGLAGTFASDAHLLHYETEDDGDMLVDGLPRF